MIKLVTARPWNDYFPTLAKNLFEELQSNELLTLHLLSETTTAIRLNASRVRQITDVEDTVVHLELILGGKQRITAEMPLVGMWEDDFKTASELVDQLRQEAKSLPQDSLLSEPIQGDSSEIILEEQNFRQDDWMQELLKGVESAPTYGIVSAGRDTRALINNRGTSHWFQVSRYFFDYSIRSQSGLAVKGQINGLRWDPKAFASAMNTAQNQLAQFGRPSVPVAPGPYRAYFAPAAVDALLEAAASSFGEGALRRGLSPMKQLKDEGQSLNPMVHLWENALPEAAPRFNEVGAMGPKRMPVLSAGRLVNTLVGPRSAKEFGVASNGAVSLALGAESLWGSERLRSLELGAGQLPTSQVLKALDRGLYIGQLHYLNWSDTNAARITGLTRFDCFWVENGQIQGPVQPLRFDDCLLELLGDRLEALTQERTSLVDTMTYDRRALRGSLVPGALVNGFQIRG